MGGEYFYARRDGLYLLLLGMWLTSVARWETPTSAASGGCSETWGPRKVARLFGGRRSGGALEGCLSHGDGDPTWSAAHDDAAQRSKKSNERMREDFFGHRKRRKAITRRSEVQILPPQPRRTTKRHKLEDMGSYRSLREDAGRYGHTNLKLCENNRRNNI